MRSNALYFPYIALPDDTWTYKALLYWDKLSSIVPMGYLNRPEQMSDFMRALLTEGLVEPIVPAHHIHQVERFDEAFIELIENRLRNRNRHRGWHGDVRTTRIHAEKLGRIPKFLVKSGLAREVSWAWYDVETTTANQFMAYLAACLGAVRGVDATPVTDKLTFAIGLRSPLSARHPGHAHKSREVVLRHLLPCPVGRVQLDKLLSFKRQYGHLLPPLRAKVETHCTLVARLPDANERIEANEAFLLECKQDIAEIEDAMRPTFGKVVLGSLSPLFGAGLLAHASSPGATAAYAGATLTLAGAAYNAIASIRGGRGVRNRPLAYVAHARRAFASNVP